MRDPLDIRFSSTKSYTITPSEDVRRAGEKLLSISDLTKKLQYYNRHICSLSYWYPSEGFHCFGEYDDFHGMGTVFFKKTVSTDEAAFQSYLQERQREINRLKRKVHEKQTYADKLKSFIEEKAGQPRLDALKVESNEWIVFITNGAGTVPEHLRGSNVVIDLKPSTSSEINAYNQYIRQHVEQIIAAPEQFHWLIPQSYRGFLFADGLEAFQKQLSRALNKKASIDAELRRIELKFQYHSLPQYMELLYPYSIEEIATWQSALFNAFVHGYDFDNSRKMLSVDEMQAYVHVEQVFAYYKEIHEIKTTLDQPTINLQQPIADTSDSFKEVTKKIIDSTQLSDFLSVPAPDLHIENAFWHDLKGQPIDCNIYHHKYGYKGFETTTSAPIVTSFQPVTIYQDALSGKYVYCQYYQPMLCTADEKEFVNKDGESVIKVPYIQTHRTQPAKNQVDFGTICEREFAAQQLTDSPEVRIVFFEELIRHTRQLMELHRQSSQYKNGLSIGVLALAEQFIEYIQHAILQNRKYKSKRSSRSVSKVLTGLFCSLMNEAGIHLRDANETVEAYCQRICSRYHLEYTDKVRQSYPNSENRKNLQRVIDQLLPRLPQEEQSAFASFLTSRRSRL